MISFSDQAYIQTKQLLLKRGAMEPVFSALAQWCEARWEDARVLNIIYEPDILGRPRLEIIFKKETSVQHLRTEDSLNFCSVKSNHIVAALNEFKARHSCTDLNTKNMFVIGAAFETVAKREAVSKLSKSVVEKIGRKVFGRAYWNNLIFFGSIVIFVRTNQQKRDAKNSDRVKLCTELLKKPISRFDTFKYFSQNPLVPLVDSKENFDKNFNSSWFNYTR